MASTGKYSEESIPGKKIQWTEKVGFVQRATACSNCVKDEYRREVWGSKLRLEQ